MENEENRIVETVDEDGNVISFELYDIIEIEEQEYALLLPIDDDDDNDSEEGELVIMRLTQDGEEYIFETIDSDDEFNKVAEYVESMDEENEEE